MGWLRLRVGDNGWPTSLFTPFFISPFAICAQSMKLLVAYFITVDSVSVILSSKNVQDAVFNSLAMTFVAELTGPYWEFLRTVFHMSSFDDFDFHLQEGTWNNDELTDRDYELNHIQCKTLMGFFFKHCRCLRSDKGSQGILSFMTALCLSLVYVQQTFVVMFALHTDVLPMARDVCTMWRWQHGQSLFLKKLAVLFELVLNYCLFFIDIEDETDYVVKKRFENNCGADGGYYRMGFSDRLTLAAKYPVTIWGTVSVVVCLIVLPEIIYWLCSCREGAAGVGAVETEQRKGNRKARLHYLEREARKHERELEDVRKDIRALAVVTQSG